MPDRASLDYLFGRRLVLRQLPKGSHRAGTDTVLLAAAAPRTAGGLIIDLGCGVGTVGIAAALFDPAAAVVLVDCDPAALVLAAENATRNGVAGRSQIIKADILGTAAARRTAGLVPNKAAVVLTNPPFAEETRVRSSPNPSRRNAHVLPDGGLDIWVKTACDLLAPGGSMIMIHRADALPAVLKAMDRRFGAIAVRPVLPRDGAASHRMLIRGIRGSRAPFTLLPPLVLHAADGSLLPEAEAIHRGELPITWQS